MSAPASLAERVAAGTFDPAADAGLLETDPSLLELELDGLSAEYQPRLVMLAAVQLAYRRAETARGRRALLAEFAAQAEPLAVLRSAGAESRV
jgi:hypothetical protein